MAAALPFLAPVAQIGGGIASGIGGKQDRQRAAEMAGRNEQVYRDMAESNIGTSNLLRDQMASFSNPDLANQVLQQAQGLGGTLQGIADTASGQIGSGGFMGDAASALAGAGNFNEYNFSPVQDTLTQARAFSDEMGDIARTQASDQTALATRQAEAQLDAALAGRGFSRNSGAAAEALGQLQQQNALSRAGLEGQLAEQAGNLGLQASQFDIQSGLNLAGMGSQYNLGLNQLRSQTGLGQASGLMGLQGLQDQQALARAQLQSGAATTGFDALSGTYAQNYLNPQIALANPLATIASYQGGYAQSGLDNLLKTFGDSAAAGGAGMGTGVLAGLGGITNAAGDWQTNMMDLLNSLFSREAGGGITSMPVSSYNPRMGTR